MMSLNRRDQVRQALLSILKVTRQTDVYALTTLNNILAEQRI